MVRLKKYKHSPKKKYTIIVETVIGNETKTQDISGNVPMENFLQFAA